jgi:hypothetical protein
VTAMAIRRLCLAVDVESYSGRTRAAQLDVQNRLLWMMVQACQAGGVTPARCDRQDSGDGQILLFPGGINEAAALPNAVLGLLTALHRVNNPPGAGGRIRLRVSLGQGAIEIGATGFVAPAVVTVCRLLESSELRAELTASKASDAACIVTRDLYDDMFVHGYGGLPANAFKPVHISQPAKKFEADAWLAAPAQVPLLAAVPAYPDVTALERKQLSGGSRVLLDLGAAAGLAWALFAASKRGVPLPGVHVDADGDHGHHTADHADQQHGDTHDGSSHDDGVSHDSSSHDDGVSHDSSSHDDGVSHDGGPGDSLWDDGAHHDPTADHPADDGFTDDNTDGYGTDGDGTDGYGTDGSDAGDYGDGQYDQSFSF